MQLEEYYRQQSVRFCAFLFLRRSSCADACGFLRAEPAPFEHRADTAAVPERARRSAWQVRALAAPVFLPVVLRSSHDWRSRSFIPYEELQRNANIILAVTVRATSALFPNNC